MNYQRHSPNQQAAVDARSGPLHQLFVAESIEVVNDRRHEGNRLVNPPCRHLDGGWFETAVLDDDAEGRYVYLSDLGEPYSHHVNDFFKVAW